MMNVIIVSLAMISALFVTDVISPAHAQSCLGPAQQQRAIANGQARRFGAVARAVSKRMNGTVVNGQLCRRGGRLVYVLTVVKKNGETRRAVVDAKSGR